MNKKEISILLGLFASILLSVFAGVNSEANSIRENTLRLHVISADDSAENIRIKMAVAQKVQSACYGYSKNAQSYQQALASVQDNLEYIKNVADRELSVQGADYEAVCSIENFYFDTTKYSGMVIPAGEYTALIVRLGGAEGKNWWCVMYPEICVGCSEEKDSDNALWEDDEHIVKLKAVELWQGARQFFRKTVKYDKI